MVSDDLAIQIARAQELAAGARARIDRIAREVAELKRVIDTGEVANGTRAGEPAQAEVSSG